jgi:hypothetical protein
MSLLNYIYLVPHELLVHVYTLMYNFMCDSIYNFIINNHMTIRILVINVMTDTLICKRF